MKKFHLKHTHNANAIKSNEQNAANDAKEDARFVCNTNRFCLFFSIFHRLSLSLSLYAFPFSFSHKLGVALSLQEKLQPQLMHDFWRVSANVILYLCMRNASISIGVFLVDFFFVCFVLQMKKTANDEKTERKRKFVGSFVRC